MDYPASGPLAFVVAAVCLCCRLCAGNSAADSTGWIYRNDTKCFGPCIFTNAKEAEIKKEARLDCEEIYDDKAYSHATTSSDIHRKILSTVTPADYVLVGARKDDSPEYIVAAIGRYDDVFRDTSGNTKKAEPGHGPLDHHQKAFWYYHPGLAFGFSPTPDIDLALADTKHLNDDKCAQRLSWHLDNQLGGWRAGCHAGLKPTENYRKVLKYCRSKRVGRPTGTDLMNYSDQRFMVVRTKTFSIKPSTLSVNPIRIGTALTLDCCSGYAGAGMWLKRGYMLFVEWLNTVRGGVTIKGQKRPLEVTFIDDRSDKKTVEKIADHMTKEGIRFFLGPYGSGLSEPQAKVVQKAGGVMITPVAGSTSVYEDRDGVFGVFMSSKNFFDTSLQELSALGAQTYAIVHDKNSVMAAAAVGAVEKAKSLGMELKFQYNYTGNQDAENEASIIADQLRKHEPDVLLGATYASECKAFIKEIIDQNIDIKAMVFTICVAQSSFKSEFGKDGNYIAGTTPWLYNMDFESKLWSAAKWTSRDFHEAYKASYDDAPSYHAALAWTAVATLVHAMEKADSVLSDGSIDTGEVKKKLATLKDSNSITTIFGKVSFNDIGLNTNQFKAVQHSPEDDYNSVTKKPEIGSSDMKVAAPKNDGKSTYRKWAYPAPPWKLRNPGCFDFPGADKLCVKGLKELSENDCQADPDCKAGPKSWYKMECVSCDPNTESATWDEVGSIATDSIAKDVKACVCKPRKCKKKGEIRNVLGKTPECIACDKGKFADVTGTCKDCAAGRFANTTSNDPTAAAECHECPAGKVNNVTGRSSCDFCPPGRVSRPGELYCQKCRRGTKAPNNGSVSCELCEAGTVATGESSSTCVNCPSGRASVWGGWRCDDCVVGKFQTEEKMSVCDTCPVGTSCSVNGTIDPMNKNDFWRYRKPPAPDAWYPCNEGEVCLAGEKCAPGQTGFLCAVCLPGYARGFASVVCNECPDKVISIVAAVLVLLVVMSGILYVTNVAVAAAGKAKAITDALLKLLVNYLTTISITCAVFNIIYTRKVMEDSKKTGEVDNTSDNPFNEMLSISITELVLPLLRIDCLFMSQEMGPWVDVLRNSNHSQFYDPIVSAAREKLRDYHWENAFLQIVFWFIAPVAFLVVLLVFCYFSLYFSLMCNRKFWESVVAFMDQVEEMGYGRAQRNYSKAEAIKLLEAAERKMFGIYPYYKYFNVKGCSFICAFLHDSQPIATVAMFLLYPTVVQMILEPLRCERPMGGLVGIRHSKSYDVECYDMNDSLFWLSVSGLIVYCFGVPAFGAFHLYNNPRAMELRFLRTWGFLMSGYEHGLQHWECIVLFRKSLTLILVSISMHEGIRVLLLLLLASSFSLAHITYQPFDNRFNELLDRVECRHLLVWVLFCLAILWTYLSTQAASTDDAVEGDASNTSILAVAVTLCFLHVWFLLMIARQIWRHSSVSYAEYLVKRYEKRNNLHKMGEVTGELSHGVGQGTASLAAWGKADRSSDRPPESADMEASISSASQAPPGKPSTYGTSSMTSSGSLRERVKSGHLEQEWFGGWAQAYYDRYLDRKPHIICDQTNMWFTLLGNHSHKVTAAQFVKSMHEHDTKFADIKLPGTVHQANEKQRRYFLKILMEAFEYVIVSMNIQTFSTSLLEFVLRCGFTFTASGSLRMADKRDMGAHSDERFATKVVLDDMEERPTERDSKRRSSISEAIGNDLDSMENKVGKTGAAVTGSGGEFAGHMLSTEENVIPDGALKELVKEMFMPDIFDNALSLEELQLNLNMLRTTTERNLRNFLQVFEEEWTAHRTIRIEEKIAAKRAQKEAAGMATAEAEAEAEAAAEAADPMSGMASFKGDDGGLSDEEEQDSDEEAQLGSSVAAHAAPTQMENSCQAALDRSESLAALGGAFNFGEEGLQAKEAQSSEAARAQDARIKAAKAQEGWVRLAAAVIHDADVKAARLPAVWGLEKMRKKEQKATDDVQTLLQEIAEAKKQLDEARAAQGQEPPPSDELAVEREDLELTRAAIKEAQEEIEKLKIQLAEQQSSLGQKPDTPTPGPAAARIGRPTPGPAAGDTTPQSPPDDGNPQAGEPERLQVNDGPVPQLETRPPRPKAKAASGGILQCVGGCGGGRD